MSTTKLPDKLSELLYIALEDLEKIEADPRYKINMDLWHRPNGKCSVCAAGSVMAVRLGAHTDDMLEPSDFEKETENKLYAINYLREGRVADAYYMLHGVDDEHLYFIDDDESIALNGMSQRRRAEWKKHMASLIGILKAEGL
jgi:ribosomal protein S27AE